MVFRPSFTDSPDYIQSLDRGLQVLRAFSRERPRCTLSEIAAQIGLSRAVARRSLLTLQHLGYVAAQDRHFFLTPRVLELGYSCLSSLDLTELSHEAMEQLSQRVGEWCSMAVALKKMLPALHRARQAIEQTVARDGWQPLTVSRSSYG